MFYDDHPPPHFHVKYAEYSANISIKDLQIINGQLPPRALGMVIEWGDKHKKELLAN